MEIIQETFTNLKKELIKAGLSEKEANEMTIKSAKQLSDEIDANLVNKLKQNHDSNQSHNRRQNTN